ncbi:MAG: AsmA family protein, partial [Kofleriaceae bacterium]
MARAPRAERRRRPWRWVRRILLGLAMAAVIAIAALVVAVHTDWGRELVREQVEAQLNQTFVGGGRVGRIEGSPFGELVLRDVVINDPEGRPAISVRTATVRLALLPLLHKRAHLRHVRAEDIEVDLRRDARGELWIEKLTRPGPSSGWGAVIDQLELRRAHVAVEIGGAPMNLDGIELFGAARFPASGPLELDAIARGSWRERGAPIALEALARYDGDRGQLRLPYATARIGGVTASAVALDLVVPPGPLAGFAKFLASPPRLAGALVVSAPRHAVAALVPSLALPDDVSLVVEAAPAGGSWNQLQVIGRLGATPLRGLISADLATLRARGVVASGLVDPAPWTGGALEGSAAAVVVFEARAPIGRRLPIFDAMVHLRGELAGVPETSVALVVSSDGERGSAVAGIAGQGGLVASLVAELRATGDRIVLDRATLLARTSDPVRTTGGAAPLRGSLDARLHAHGTLAPTPDLAVTGTLAGSRLRAAGVSVESVRLAIDASRLPRHPRGRAELHARGIARGAFALRSLELTAASREDGRIAVALRSRPPQDPGRVEVDAMVSIGETTTVELQRHHVRAGGGQDWVGSGGWLAIGPRRIELRGLTSRVTGDRGALALDGSFQRAGRGRGDLALRLRLESFALTNLALERGGTLDASLDITRTRGRFAGSVALDLEQLEVVPELRLVEAHARIDASPEQLVVTADATGLGVGRAELALDIDPPDDLADLDAWQRLGRSAIRTGRLALHHVDLCRLARTVGVAPLTAGTLDGELQLSATATGGRLRIRDLAVRGLTGLP